jgi:hypothetical protein
MTWLIPGDVLMFARDGFYNRLIRIKTWSRVSHCEVVSLGGAYGAAPLVVASRNSQGVGQYQLDAHGLYCTLRPTSQRFDVEMAMDWFWRNANGQDYDWIGLLAFTSAKFQGKDNGRMFCSEFATRFLRAGGLDPFNGADADAIAPSDFLKNSTFSRLDIAANRV